MDLYERIAAATSLESDDAGLVLDATLAPAAGPESKVFPPRYPDLEGGYLFEERYVDGAVTRTVLLDAVQAQANAVEEALDEALRAGRLSLPHLLLQADVDGRAVRVSTLTAPHRSADAYFRDSVLADDSGTKFDRSIHGERLRNADVDHARAVFELSPLDLVLGFWDSHRKGRNMRVARIYTSEVIGLEPLLGKRAAARVDPFNLTSGSTRLYPEEDGGFALTSSAKGAGKKASEHGHGMIPPQASGGGVSIRRALRRAHVNLVGLAKLSFGEGLQTASPEQDRAARAVLAALALLGDRLAFDRPALFLRSGCELVTLDSRLRWHQRGGSHEDLTLLTQDAAALLEHSVAAAKATGLQWPERPVLLRPGSGLQELFRLSFRTAEAEAEQS